MNATQATMDPSQKDFKYYNKCPFCNGSIIKKYAGLEDRLNTTTKKFQIYECNNCEAAFLNPMPIGDTSDYYPVNYLSGEKSKETASKRFDLEKWYRYNQYANDFNLLQITTGMKIRAASSYLDIGCGSGERVTFVKEQGCINSCGLDKFDFSKNRSRLKAEIINSEILSFDPKDKIQIVSLFHVLEHLENPKEVLAHIKNTILKEDGYLILQVPNYSSFERYIFGKKWFCFDAPRHLWHFNKKALRNILSKADFKIEAVFARNAPLHPVSIVSSIFKDLDVQRIWIDKKHGNCYKRMMQILWTGLTILTIPLNILQNIFKRSSMLTIIASNK